MRRIWFHILFFFFVYVAEVITRTHARHVRRTRRMFACMARFRKKWSK